VAMYLALTCPQLVSKLIVVDIAPANYPVATGEHDNLVWLIVHNVKFYLLLTNHTA
jgi:pimeloyl-ACP methyl ester carboxylesterase